MIQEAQANTISLVCFYAFRDLRCLLFNALPLILMLTLDPSPFLSKLP